MKLFSILLLASAAWGQATSSDFGCLRGNPVFHMPVDTTRIYSSLEPRLRDWIAKNDEPMPDTSGHEIIRWSFCAGMNEKWCPKCEAAFGNILCGPGYRLLCGDSLYHVAYMNWRGWQPITRAELINILKEILDAH